MFVWKDIVGIIAHIWDSSFDIGPGTIHMSQDQPWMVEQV